MNVEGGGVATQCACKCDKRERNSLLFAPNFVRDAWRAFARENDNFIDPK